MARRRAPGRGSTYEDERGRWIAQIYINGRKVRRVARSQSDAEDLLDELRAKRDGGIAPKGQTVADYLEAWLRDSAAEEVRPSTLQGYERKIRGYVIPSIGRIKLERLTPQQVQHMLTDMRKGGLSPGTRRQTRAILRAALTQARGCGARTARAGAAW